MTARGLARWRRLGRLTLRSPERVEPVIEEWRTEVKRFGMGPATVYDPTRWSTDDLLRDIGERPLEPPAEEPPPEPSPPAKEAG